VHPHGLRPAVAAGSGVIVADAVYRLLSITGLAAILVASHKLFAAIKSAGVAYQKEVTGQPAALLRQSEA
jgi:threonine/homoserine/homoserine lactone efflux protein